VQNGAAEPDVDELVALEREVRGTFETERFGATA